MSDLDLEAIKAEFAKQARYDDTRNGAGMVPTKAQLIMTLVAEVERLREALGSCGGFLVTLRDTCDYDFTLAHEEQIGRLCQEIFHTLHPQEQSDKEMQ